MNTLQAATIPHHPPHNGNPNAQSEVRYLTKIRIDQKEFVRKAADELELKHPQVIQIALDALMTEDWAGTKRRILSNQAKKSLDAVITEIATLERRKQELERQVIDRQVKGQ